MKYPSDNCFDTKKIFFKALRKQNKTIRNHEILKVPKISPLKTIISDFKHSDGGELSFGNNSNELSHNKRYPGKNREKFMICGARATYYINLLTIIENSIG